MTLGTSQRRPKPHLRDISHTVSGINCAVFFFLGSPFLGGLQKPIVARGHLLLQGGIGKQITRQLLDGEISEGLVLIEGINDVVAIRSDLHLVVAVVSNGVGVTDQIQPPYRHTLAVFRIGQKTIHQPAPRLGRLVIQKLLPLLS